MGGSRWDSDSYTTRQDLRASTNSDAFAHSKAMASSAPADQKVHDDLNPKGKIRESRDSEAHPESLAIAVFLDVTGSMERIVRGVQAKLGGLMAIVMQKAHEHPQVMFGGVGDANSDKAPLQVGQFESGLEIDDDLTKIWLEGGGGGQNMETYELAHYFVDRHTSIDCWEKRQQKGFFFSIGDEAPYDKIKAAHVENLIGDKLEADLSIEDVLATLGERYHVFHIHCDDANHRGDRQVIGRWKELLGERALVVEDHKVVAEVIASTIATVLGADLSEVLGDLKVAGSNVAAIEKALVPLSQSGAVVSGGVAVATLPEAAVATTDSARRL